MKLAQLAQKIGARLVGDGNAEVKAVASLQQAGGDEITFVSNIRHADLVSQTQARAVIVPQDFSAPSSAALLYVADVDVALEKVLGIFAPPTDSVPVGVHPSAQVSPTASLAAGVAVGANVVIGENTSIANGTVISPGCVIGRDVRIGKNCYLWPNVVINWGCVLGDNVIIHANSTIGTDGFGYRLVEGRHHKIPHIGTVLIEDDVEIGANSCVDRAKFGRTIVGRGTKIDNLVMIAHNVRIGEHCIIIAQTGIAGSSRLGKYVVLAGQCGISDHVNIGDGAMVGAKSGILSDVADGAKVMGIPARSFTQFYRDVSWISKLPELAKEIKKLQKQMDKDAGTKNHR